MLDKRQTKPQYVLWIKRESEQKNAAHKGAASYSISIRLLSAVG
jgi:hypothetical protein